MLQIVLSIVPTLCVGTHRVDALRRVIEHTAQSAPTPVPTQSVGTINSLLTTHYSLLTIHYSLLTIHYSKQPFHIQTNTNRQIRTNIPSREGFKVTKP